MRDTSRKFSDIMSEVLRENNMGQHLLEHRAANFWQMIMGPTVNSVTREVRVSNGIMYVELSSSVVRQELYGLKKEILKKINDVVGENVIRDIQFR